MLRGSGVDAIAPLSIGTGVSGQVVVLDGYGLATVSGAQLTPAAGITIVAVQPAPDGRRVQLTLDVAADAKIGTRKLRLLKAGAIVPALRPEAEQILVAAPGPVIESITPSFVARGNALTLVIRGRNLRGLPVVLAARDPEQPVVRFTPAAGIEVSSTPISNADGTEVQVAIRIAPDAPISDRVVQLDTLSGSSTPVASPANTLRIAPGPITALSPFVSPVVRVLRPATRTEPRFAASATVGVVRGPFIREIDPAGVELGRDSVLTLRGRGLGSATSIRLVPPDGITLQPGTFQAATEQAQVSLSVAPNASLFARRVELVLPDRVLRAPQLLQVRDAQPALTALTPTWLLRDGVNQVIEIQGEFLTQTTAARLIPDQGVIIESYQVLDAGRARLTLRAAANATTGPRVVVVSSPTASSSATAAPANTLYIRDRKDVLTPFVAPALGVLRRSSAPPTLARFGFSSALGVVRGHYASALAPRLWRRGINTRVEVTGRGLQNVTGVELPGSEGVTVQGLQAETDGSRLRFEVQVAADAPPGSRRLRLRTAATDIHFVPLEAGIAEVDDNSAIVPEAEPDAYTGFANGSIAVESERGVLANDSDPSGGTLSAVLRKLPASGLLELSVDGSFTYTPNADFAGVDRFEYSPANATTLGASTVVTLTVAERDDAHDDNYLVGDNQTLEVPAALGLLANDRLAAGDPPEIALVSQPTRGQLQLAADGSFTYDPQQQSGLDTFSYRLIGGGVQSLPAQVRITIQDINEAPLARDDAYIGDRGVALQVPVGTGVLRNDTDPDGDALQARLLSNPAVGSLALANDGSFHFTPPSDFVGETSFTYEAFDPRGLRSTATVRLTINDTLAALDDNYSMDEGEVLFVDGDAGLLANDSLYPQGTLRILLDTLPQRGTVQIAPDGGFVYTPASSDYSGTDTFRYRLRDDRVTSPSALVTITIRGVDDPPQAKGENYLTDENADLIVAAPGVLANDTDVDSTTLRAQLVTQPQHGVVNLGADGRFSYVPEVNYRGPDGFEYSATDATGASLPVRVEIQVTQPPTATNDVYLVDIDTPIDIIDPKAGLLINDHDAPEKDRLYALPGEQPRNGTLALNENGTFRYVPNPGFQGLDVWTYQVTDTRSESNFATVTMAVGITSLPRAVPDAYETTEDAELVVSAATGLLLNDTDADTPKAQLEAYLVGYPDGLSVTVAKDGSFRLRPPANFFGETFFIYQIYDGTDVSNSAVVTVKVNPVNDGVEANDDAFGVLRNTVFSTDRVRVNDRWDPDFPVRFEITVPPQYGAAVMDPNLGSLRYTPQQDFAGLDRLTYRLYQVATGVSDTAVISLRTNAPPVTAVDPYSTTEDSLVEVTPNPLANDSDPDGDTISLVSNSFTGVANGLYVTTLSVDDRTTPTRTTLNAYAHFYGSVDITYRVTDGTEQSTGTMRVTVAPVPDDPRASDNSYQGHRNVPVTVSSVSQGVLGNDFDPDARPHAGGTAWAAAAGVDLQPLRAELVEDVAHGTLTLAETGTFHYVPDSDYSGTDRFRYRAKDATGRYSLIATVTIRINSPPIAGDDAYVANEDTVLVVPAGEGVLINDSDIDGDAVRARTGTTCSPCNGRVQMAADGSFRYTPNRDFHGTDEFFYSIYDGISGADSGRVTINVLPVNDPPLTDSDTYRTREDTVLIAPEPQGVLRNDREVDGDQLGNAELVQPAGHGRIEFQPDGSFGYTPDVDFNGRDTFRYRVFDRTGLSTEEDVEVLVTPVNDAPVAGEDAYATPLDQPLEIDAAAGLLRNDRDVDGPSLSVSLITPPQHGVMTLAPDGSFRYEPDGYFTGVERVQYQLDDGLGALAIGNVLIEIEPIDPQVEVTAESDFFRFEGPRLELDAPGVLANDTLQGPGTLAVRLLVPPAVGQLVLRPDGGFSYTAPDGYAGVTGFSYAAEAGGSSAVAQVTLDVQRVDNVPPQAHGEVFGVLEDAQLDSRRIGSLLANDRDHEGAALLLDVITTPAHGSVQLLGQGHFLYTPAPDFHGTDRLTYRVSDGVHWSSQAVAELTVFAQNDAPTAHDDAYRTRTGEALVVATAGGVLANDVDVDQDALMVEIVDAPRRGQLTMDPAGGFRYVPLAGESGSDNFRYAATDLLAQSVATVQITISDGNRPPVAAGETFAIEEDGEADSARFGLLTANDTDPDGDALTLRLEVAPAHGELLLDGAAFRYRPSRDWAGRDSFRYVVSDGDRESAPVEAVIEVQQVNDAPRAETDLYSTLQDTPLHVGPLQGLLSNDVDVEQDTLTLTLSAPPSHGRLELGPEGGFGYVPAAGFHGRDEFAYRLSDGRATALGRVVIDVTRAANSRPLATGERYTIAEDSVLDTRNLQGLLANDRDPDGASLSLVPLAAPTSGTLQWLDGGHLRYIPARDRIDTITIPYAVSDGELESAPVAVTVEFVPQNDPPQAAGDVFVLAPGASVLELSAAAGVLANDSDPDAETLVATALTSPAGTLQLGLDGSVRYVPPVPRPAQVEFRYRATDAAGLHSDAAVLLMMDPQAAPVRIFNHGFE